MIGVLDLIARTAARRWRRLALLGLGLALGFQALMLAMLMVRFGQAPNYVIFYDWVGAVAHIVRSTPSWSDVFPIIAQEWLVELGYITDEFGAPISVWSLNVNPTRLATLFVLGAVIGLCWEVARPSQCSAAAMRGAGAATGLGALAVAATNVTMSWVVCCAAPSWVVGLAILGVGVSTSLALESLGPALSYGGFALLLLSMFGVAWLRVRREAALDP